MAYKIVTKQAGAFTVEDIIEDIGSENNNRYVYYVFVGKHTEYSNAGVIPAPIDNEETIRQVYQDMLFGKMIKSNNVRAMIARNEYFVNEVYDTYDDKDQDLFNKKFFVIVKNGSSYDVFKCLENNGGKMSTIEPSRLDVNYSDEIYRTSDNYVWKYMYTISSSDMNDFATDAYIPVVANNQVVNNAVSGSIDVIKVEFGGSRYDNYLSGSIGASDLNIDGSKYKINISGNNSSAVADDFYVGCIFKVVSGNGVGSYSKITSYNTSGNNRVITLSDELTLDLTSTYEISPGVVIEGDYYQTSNAVARAIVNSASANSISYIEVLDRGSGYKYANAYVYYNTTVPVQSSGAEAIIRPVLPPKNGHGHDVMEELGANKVCFSMTFNEAVDLFPSKNDFRQVGVIVNPKFANVVVNFTSKTGSFQADEHLYKMSPVRLYGSNVTINTSSNTITATAGTADFSDSLNAGDFLYFSGSGSHQLAKVAGITNSTSMTIDSVGAFSCTDTQLFLANITGQAKVVNDQANSVVITESFYHYTNGDKVIGRLSGAYGVVDSMELNGETTDLAKFNQMWRYGISTSDTFTEDEVVYQDLYSLNHAFLHSVNGNSNPKTMMVTNQYGIVNIGGKIYGNTSLASADVLDKYQPDLIFNSGSLIYLENLEPVIRDSGQKETFKIIFEY